MGSKYILRIRQNGRLRHFLNPSNLGIAVTFLVLPWVATIPYQFTEGVRAEWDWLLPLVIVLLGTNLNMTYTKRMPTIVAFLVGFVAQAAIRAAFGSSFIGGLMPMTGVAFVLFTFYMITDPMTSPRAFWPQVAYGLGIAATYGILISGQVVFTLFFSVTIVASVRGVLLLINNVIEDTSQAAAPNAVAAK